MNASLILPVSSFVSRLLATTALTTILLAAPADNKAMAQIIIGGDQPSSGVETTQQDLPALPQKGEWPYNVKPSKKAAAALAPVDPSKLSSRQVSPKLMEAAHLMQSGLSPDQVQEAMNTPAPIMAAPELQGDKPDAPRDADTTFPAVATGPLMASLANDGAEPAPVADAAPEAPAAMATATAATPTDTNASKNVLVPPMAVASAADIAPSSLTALDAPAAPQAVAPEAPKPASSSGRSLFGGQRNKERMQVADNATTSRPSSSESDLKVVDNGDHTLKMPGEQKPASADTSASLQVPDAAPAVDVAATPTPPVAAPSDTARNSTPAKIAPLTSLSAPPKLLARIGDNSRGAVQRPADRPAETAAAKSEPVPDAAPVAPVTPEPKEPAREAPAAAVLPAKPDEPAQAALVPMPQPQGDDDTPPAPQPAVAAAPVATPAPAAKPAHKTFWNRIFGSDEDHPEDKPAPLPPVEAPKPVARITPEASAPVMAAAPVAVAATETAPAPEEHVLRAPEPVQAPAPAPAPVQDAHVLRAPEPAAAPVAEPTPVAAAEPVTVPAEAEPAVVAQAEPAPQPAPSKPEKPTPATHMLVAPKDEPVVADAAPVPAPEPEPTPPAPKAKAKKVADAPAALPEGYVPSASAADTPKAVETPAPVAMAAPEEPAPSIMRTAQVEPEPEPVVEAAPAPAVVADARPAEPAKKRRTLWGDLFGDDEPETQQTTTTASAETPVVALAAIEPAADEEPFEPIPTAGLGKPSVTDNPGTLGRTAKAAPATEAALPKPEDRPAAEPVAAAVEPVPEPVAVAAPAPKPVKAAKAKAAPAAIPSGYVPSASAVDAPKAAAASESAPVPFEPIPETRYIEVPERTVAAPQAAVVTPVYVEPAAAPAPAPAPVVPAFRIEAPTAPNADGGLVTPRLVPVAPAAPVATARAPLAAPATASVSVPSGAPLAQINFIPANQSVDSVGQAQLQAIAEAMQMAPQTRLLLNSYAKAANESESRRISLNRALVVRTRLAELGIQPSRVDVQALGEQTPSDIDGGRDRVDALLH